MMDKECLLPSSLIPVSLTPDTGNASWRRAPTTLTTIATPATRENEDPECSAEQQNACTARRGKGNHFGSPVKLFSGRNQGVIF
jgi:hypothetical protein